METYTELNVAASDLHESDLEEVWSNDLGWVPKSDLQAAREKEVTKLREFDTFEEVLQDEAEGDIISSRFVDKWDTSGELRSRLVSRGYEGVRSILLHSLLQHRRSRQQELHCCWDWRMTWIWPWRTFLEPFFMQLWNSRSR